MTSIRIQGIKFDEKSSFQRGSRLAPPLIREAFFCPSANLAAENGELIDLKMLDDKGDFDVGAYFDIEEVTRNNLDDEHKLLTLGGDHSITFPIIKAHHDRFPILDILQIDAHSDLYEEFDGDPYSHACPFARIMENGYASRLVQVGIRTLNPHQKAQAERFQVEIHQMKNLDLAALPEFENPLYISIDLDGIDPAFAPGVSHYEPGGLTSRQVIELIQNLNCEIVGADIVEYNPNRDFNRMTAYLAAKLMKELITKMTQR